ncbi:type II toxin-antitoxin system RelE/ParE family toxin [Serratia marcescens]|uniref:type II toxin-antitoxin system RelE/ParE family toxin n=1 Tax=Serratia marcescens TaxID=615 RepID=UPI003FA7AA81
MADIYLTKTFLGFAARERISDATIVKAAREMQRQLYDANLGGCVYKSASLGLVRQMERLSGTDRFSR